MFRERFIECKCVDIDEVVGSHATSAWGCAYGDRLFVFKVAASLNKVKKGVVRVCCVNWRQGSRFVEVAKIKHQEEMGMERSAGPCVGCDLMNVTEQWRYLGVVLNVTLIVFLHCVIWVVCRGRPWRVLWLRIIIGMRTRLQGTCDGTWWWFWGFFLVNFLAHFKGEIRCNNSNSWRGVCIGWILLQFSPRNFLDSLTWDHKIKESDLSRVSMAVCQSSSDWGEDWNAHEIPRDMWGYKMMILGFVANCLPRSIGEMHCNNLNSWTVLASD